MIRAAFLTLAKAVMAQANRDVGPRMISLESTMDSRIMECVRMNPLIFLVFREGVDPQDFFDGIYEIVYAMGVTSRENAGCLPIN